MLASRGFKMHNFSVVQTDIHSCQKTRNQPTVPSIIFISYVINIIFFWTTKGSLHIDTVYSIWPPDCIWTIIHREPVCGITKKQRHPHSFLSAPKISLYLLSLSLSLFLLSVSTLPLSLTDPDLLLTCTVPLSSSPSQLFSFFYFFFFFYSTLLHQTWSSLNLR